MGQLKGDGRATNVTAPGGTAIVFGDFYRIEGWNGFALAEVPATGGERNFALECSSERIWYVPMPAGVAAAKGAHLYWSSGTGLKVGLTDLVATAATAGDAPCAKVEEAKDANGIVGIRALNVGAAA